MVVIISDKNCNTFIRNPVEDGIVKRDGRLRLGKSYHSSVRFGAWGFFVATPPISIRPFSFSPNPPLNLIRSKDLPFARKEAIFKEE